MKSYLRLIPISAKVRKRQNRMTMLCIIISVLLVTMIFSMADMAIRMEKTRVIKEHGNWHIMLKEPSEQQIEQIAQRTDVMTSSRYDGLNFDLSEDYTINGKSCVIVGGDNAILTEIYDNLTEGRYPTKENEILLSNRSKELLSEDWRGDYRTYTSWRFWLYDFRFWRRCYHYHRCRHCGGFSKLGLLPKSCKSRRK